jgi:hypothetical protein
MSRGYAVLVLNERKIAEALIEPSAAEFWVPVGSPAIRN